MRKMFNRILMVSYIATFAVTAATSMPLFILYSSRRR